MANSHRKKSENTSLEPDAWQQNLKEKPGTW